MSDHRLRRDRRVRGLRGKFADQSIRVGGNVVRRLNNGDDVVGPKSEVEALTLPFTCFMAA